MNGGGFGALGFAASGGAFPQSGFDLGWSIGPFDFGLGSVFGSPWNLPAFPSLPAGLPDWGGPIIEYPQLPPPVPRAPTAPEEDDMAAVDWGGILGDVIGTAATGFFAPPPIPFPNYGPGGMGFVTPPPPPPAAAVVAPMALANECGLDGQVWGGQAPPKGYKVVNYCGQATLRKIRRRRRRRILSASDASDIATIVGLVGKGQMASALINRRP